MAHAEQVRGTRYSSSGARRYEKRRHARLLRRAAKLDPENAPTRMIKGWAD